MTAMAKVKWGLVLVGGVLVMIVGLQNRAPVSIDVLFWKATVDRLLLFPALFLTGLFLGFVLGWGWERKKGRTSGTVKS